MHLRLRCAKISAVVHSIVEAIGGAARLYVEVGGVHELPLHVSCELHLHRSVNDVEFHSHKMKTRTSLRPLACHSAMQGLHTQSSASLSQHHPQNLQTWAQIRSENMALRSKKDPFVMHIWGLENFDMSRFALAWR